MGFFSTLKAATATPAKTSTKATSWITNIGNTVKNAVSTAAKVIKGVASTIASAAEAAKKKAAAEKSSKGGGSSSGGGGSSSGGGSGSGGGSTPNPGDLISWGKSRFFVTPTFVRSFTGLTITASCDTEDEENGGNKYVKKKNDGSYEVKLTAILDKRLGETDVRAEAMRLAEDARTGAKDYVYNCGDKLFTPQMMGTGATIKDIVTTPKGEWISCRVEMTLKQCSKGDGTTSGSGSGGGGSGKYYKVQISGMSELKVWATSVQGAVTKACGAKYTGYVTVDGTSHYVYNGRIEDDRMKEDQKKDTVKGAKDDAKKTTDDAKSASDYLSQKFDSLKPKTTTKQITPATKPVMLLK